MNDQQLLEMAAKAAGIKGTLIEQEGMFSIRVEPKILGQKYYFWNPLYNDSQAFRLSMKLSMHVASTGTNVLARSKSVHVEYYDAETDLFGNEQSNLMKAARRAIVRAAAEVGEAMP